MLPNALGFFARYIEKELGIVYDEGNSFQLQNRLDEVAKIFRLSSLDELHAMAAKGIHGNLKQLILDTATNNETSFFRDPKVFKGIESTLASLAPGLKEPLSIWSAACSYGQEPYTLVMILEELKAKGLKLDYRILATDIADRALARAQEGRYSQLEVQRGLPTPLMIRYFTKDAENYWTFRPELKAKVEFRKTNLRSPFFLGERFHLILCRNVLIYQKVEGKSEVVSKLRASLHPGGLLILGAGESMLGVSDAFEQVDCEGAMFYRPKAA